MQIKSTAGGDSRIPATGVNGAMSGAAEAQVEQQVQLLLHSIAGNT